MKDVAAGATPRQRLLDRRRGVFRMQAYLTVAAVAVLVGFVWGLIVAR